MSEGVADDDGFSLRTAAFWGGAAAYVVQPLTRTTAVIKMATARAADPNIVTIVTDPVRNDHAPKVRLG